MLGSFGNTSGNVAAVESRARPRPEVAPKKARNAEQHSNQLLEREWSELPYAMMRLTAARRRWDANRLYWRDRNVQLGEINLHLHKTRAKNNVPGYAASYSREEIRHDFSLDPSIEDSQLRWSAPGISEVQLTTDQLADRLLSKLETFHSSGLA